MLSFDMNSYKKHKNQISFHFLGSVYFIWSIKNIVLDFLQKIVLISCKLIFFFLFKIKTFYV